MTLCPPSSNRVRHLIDRIAFGWIVAAPLVVALGVATGAVEVFGAGPPHAEPRTAISPEEALAGELLWQGPDGWVALPVLEVGIEVRVTGPMVHGSVVQAFTNPTEQVIEVVYVFPLPEDAAVHHMEMRIGPRRIVSRVQEKEQARRTYDEAKSDGRKAALVEQGRPNLFRISAANINPGERIDVRLEFVQELPYLNGEFGLALPLTYTRRFDPACGRPGQGVFADDGVPSGVGAVPEADVEVRIRAGFPLDEITSPSHDIETRWDGDDLVVAASGRPVPADRDFVLRWRPLLDDQPLGAAMVEDRHDGRHALFILLPPAERFETVAGLPTETMFVIDVSGSMQGPSIRQARAALRASLDRLRPDDAFNLVAFNNDIRPFRDRPLDATPDSVEAARDWVADLRADGGTRIDLALWYAVDAMRDGDPDRVRRIVFLTDGAVSNEDEIFETVFAESRDVRLHMLGIGAAPNRHLMTRVATLGKGLCEFIQSADGVEDRIDRFFRRLDRPVMTDLQLHWDGAVPLEVYPERLPDLHAGQALVVSARLAPGEAIAEAVLRGRVWSGELEVRQTLEASAPEQSGVAVRWARAKVRALIDRLYEGAAEDEVRPEVVAVALDHHLVTRYTSLVAVEEFPSALDEATRVGVDNALSGGEGVVLPVGGTLDPLLVRVGAVLALAGMLLLVLVRRGPTWDAGSSR